MNRPAFEVIDGGKSAGRAWLKQLYSTYGGAVFQRCRFLLKDPTAAEAAMVSRTSARKGTWTGKSSIRSIAGVSGMAAGG